MIWRVPSSTLSFLAPMAKPAGKCAFCGGREGGLTKGHIWPEWLEQVLPPQIDHHYASWGVTSFKPNYAGGMFQMDKDFIPDIRKGHVGAKKPRNTCGACNGGWMSKIEEEAKPVLTSLILGQPVLLDLERQRLLCAFLALIALRLGKANHFGAIPTGDILQLKHLREPGPSWRIWIAKLDQEETWLHEGLCFGIQYSPKSASTPKRVGAEHTNIQVTTLIAGKLIANLFCSTVMKFGGYTGVNLISIFPFEGQSINSDLLPRITRDKAWEVHETVGRVLNPSL